MSVIFNKVSAEEVKVSTSNKYSGLHDAIETLPTFTGDEGVEDVLSVTTDSEKEMNNCRNSVRTFAKKVKDKFSIRTAIIDADEGKFGFSIKKFGVIKEG